QSYKRETMKHLRSLLLASAFLAGTANVSLAAERDGVVVSIKPLHSIVSAVMQGVGEPKLIVQGAGSEHVYSLKPSDAEAIEHAKVIFWAGPSMETFLDKPIDTLGEGAKIVALGDADGLTKLKFREGGPFEAHDHGHEGHDHAAEAPEAGHGHDHGHDHGHSEFDLHFWLDPQNGKVLAADIAKTLAESDPEHAAQYEKNAKDYGEKIDAL